MNKIPKFGFLASYSPYFQKIPYYNYPNFSSALAMWVNKNTKPNTIIICPSRLYHFFYYGNRDVISLSKLKFNYAKTLIDIKRPIYFVEDPLTHINKEYLILNKIFIKHGKKLKKVSSIKTFTPHKGLVDLGVFSLEDI